MLLVLAGHHDRGAAALVSGFGEFAAALVSADDLSSPGWVLDPHHPGEGSAVASGQRVSVRDVQGVIVRRPFVLGDELTRVAPEDRAFVAAEMTAFLLAWLSGLGQLGRPVLNPPTPRCLNGPGWRPEQWAATAARLGFPVRPVLRRVLPLGDGEQSQGTADAIPSPSERRAVELPGETPVGRAVEVVVVGSHVLGSADARMRRRALRLARTAGTPLLKILFDYASGDGTFCGASPWPDIGRWDVMEALRDLFRGKAGAVARTVLGGRRPRPAPEPTMGGPAASGPGRWAIEPMPQ